MKITHHVLYKAQIKILLNLLLKYIEIQSGIIKIEETFIQYVKIVQDKMNALNVALVLLKSVTHAKNAQLVVILV